jgi:hypothetical protein
MKAEKRMSGLNKNNPGPNYVHLLAEVKERIRSAQYEAHKPIGVAAYDITKMLPEKLRGQLPQPEEIAALLEGIEE